MRPPFLPSGDDRSPLFFMWAFFVAVIIGLLFLLNVFLSHTAFAQTTNHLKESQCSTIEEFVETLNRLPSSVRNKIRVRILRDDDAARWLAAYNAIPPVSEIQMDRVAFVIGEDPQPVIIAGEFQGCVIGVSRIPHTLHERLLRDSKNEPGEVV